jgi:hypothetical protein
VPVDFVVASSLKRPPNGGVRAVPLKPKLPFLDLHMTISFLLVQLVLTHVPNLCFA